MRYARALMALLLTLALSQQTAAEESPESSDAIKQRLRDYIGAFNSGDAAATAAYWAEGAVSDNDETGERLEGRDAIREDLARMFSDYRGVRLAGRVDGVRMIRPDVAMVSGEATLFIDGELPTASAFTVVMTQEGGQWLIQSSQERDLPAPESAGDALSELDWMIGSWRDQTEGVEVDTTVRWSANRAFLIRSYRAEFLDGDLYEGTQVLGWDPVTSQFRCWNFSSDGSFGDGVMFKSDDGWIQKMTYVTGDGKVASDIQLITLMDDDTVQVEKIGRTLDGELVPSTGPVTVIRTGAPPAASSNGGALR